MNNNEIKKIWLSFMMAFGIVFFLHSGVSRAGNGNARSFFPRISKSGIPKNKTSAFPSLSLPESNFVFSKVPEGKEVTHTFVVNNKGAAILKIIKVKPG